MRRNTRAMCEAAMMVTVAVMLDLLKEFLPGKLPSGGSLLNISSLPIILFAVRHGKAWGAMAGLLFGALNYLFGYGIAIDWTTIICDYLLAFSLLGFGAGFFRNQKFAVYWGTILGCSFQFITSYLIGVFVWGKYMPEQFLGQAMTSPWLYSFLYNIMWALPNMAATLLAFAALWKPLKKYFHPITQ